MGTSVQLIDVVSWSMVIVFALTAMALAWLALFGDKPGGKARCPKCWYELGTLDSPPTLPVTCPECGKRVERPRQLSRRRLARGRLLFSLLLGVGVWFGSQLPGVSRRGWLWLVPSRVLYETLPLVGNTSALGEELQRRAGLAPWKGVRTECTLSQDDLASLLSRAARGNALARVARSATDGLTPALLRRSRSLSRSNLRSIWCSRATPGAPGIRCTRLT